MCSERRCRVQRDRSHRVDICLRDSVPLQEIPRAIRAVHLKRSSRCYALVRPMSENRPRIEQFRIEFTPHAPGARRIDKLHE